jgi:phage shock protein E
MMSRMKKCLYLSLTLGLLALAAGCGAPKPPAAAAAAVSPATAGAKILDVRSPGEFQADHLEKAINLPVDQVAARIAEVAPDKAAPLLVYCQSGRRSARAKQILQNLGYTQVRDLGSLAAARQALAGH